MARARSCGQTAAMAGIPDDASSMEDDRPEAPLTADLTRIACGRQATS